MTVHNGHKHLRSEPNPVLVDMKSVLKEGEVVAVDVSSWAVAACKGIDSARQQNRIPAVPMTRAVHQVLGKLAALLLMGVCVVIVLDGRPFGPKLSERARRRAGREAAATGLAEARTSGNQTRVDKLLKTLGFPREDFWHDLIAGVRALDDDNGGNRVALFQSPYEFDAQAVWLQRHGFVNSILTEDADLFFLGGDRLLFKSNMLLEKCQFVERRKVLASGFAPLALPAGSNFYGWDAEQLIGYASLRGNDYLRGTLKTTEEKCHALAGSRAWTEAGWCALELPSPLMFRAKAPFRREAATDYETKFRSGLDASLRHPVFEVVATDAALSLFDALRLVKYEVRVVPLYPLREFEGGGARKRHKHGHAGATSRPTTRLRARAGAAPAAAAAVAGGVTSEVAKLFGIPTVLLGSSVQGLGRRVVASANINPRTLAPFQGLAAPSNGVHGSTLDFAATPIDTLDEDTLRHWLACRGIFPTGMAGSKPKRLTEWRRIVRLAIEVGDEHFTLREPPNGSLRYDRPHTFDMSDKAPLVGDAALDFLRDENLFPPITEDFLTSLFPGFNGIKRRAMKLLTSGHYDISTLKITFAEASSGGTEMCHVRVSCTATFRGDVYPVALAFDLASKTFCGPPKSLGACVTSCVICSHMVGELVLISVIQSCTKSLEQLKLLLPEPVLETQALQVPWDAIYGRERITTDDADAEQRKADRNDRKAKALLAAEAPEVDDGGADESETKAGPVMLIAEALCWFALNTKRRRPKIVASKIEEARAAAVAGPAGWSAEKKKEQLKLFARLHASYKAKRLKPKLITPYLAFLAGLGRFNKVHLQ